MSKKARQLRALVRLHTRILSTYGKDQHIPKPMYDEWRGLIANIFEYPKGLCFVSGGTNPLGEGCYPFIGGSAARYVLQSDNSLDPATIRWDR